MPNRVLSDSENSRRDAVEYLHIPPDRIDVVPLAPGPEFRPVHDPGVLHEVLTSYGLTQDRYILSVSSLQPRKNLVRLTQAFRQATDRTDDTTTKLLLAGKPLWATDEMSMQLQSAELGNRLVLPGRVPSEDLPALLSGARAVAYVSLYEGFGLPLIEAMASGTPVIGSDTSSMPEVVGDAGFLVDPYNVSAVAEALHVLMTNDSVRTDLAHRAAMRAQRFSWSRTAELTLETYQRASRPAVAGH